MSKGRDGIKTLAAASRRSAPCRVEELGHRLLRRAHQHPVAQVEDVPLGPRLHAAVLHRRLHRLVAGEEHRGVHVALHGLGAQPLARLRHVHRPVQAHRVHAGGGQPLEQAAAAVGVEHDGDARVLRLDHGQHALDGGSGDGVPHGGRELAAPGVEEHDALRARLDLEADVLGHGLGQLVQDGVEEGGVGEGHGLDGGVGGGGLALHQVGGQRPGAAHEAQQRGAGADKLVAQGAQRVRHEAQAAQVQGAHLLHILRAAHGALDDGALHVVNLERHAQRGQGGQDVAARKGRRSEQRRRRRRCARLARRRRSPEDDHPVRTERAVGLQRDLNHQVGGLGAERGGEVSHEWAAERRRTKAAAPGLAHRSRKDGWRFARLRYTCEQARRG